MLKLLTIQNIAIAENLSAEFGPSLNVITGETGAGKSILVDALTLLRGNRVDVSLIRSGCDSATVTAVFDLPKQSPVREVLEELGIHLDDDELVLRKTIQRSGKHKSFVNDVLLHGRSLHRVAAELIDISSQFENQRLLDNEKHTYYLDAFVSANAISQRLSDLYRTAIDLLKELKGVEDKIQQQKREQALYEYEVKEIEDAQLAEAEWGQVQVTLNLGNKTALAQKLCAEVQESISEAENSCLTQLKMSQRNIEKLIKLAGNTTLPVTLENVQECLAHLENLSFAVHRSASLFDIDAESLQNAEERAEVYNKILAKFGPSLADVDAYLCKCRSYLSQSDTLEARRASLSHEGAKLIQESIDLATKLSKKRVAGLAQLSKMVEGELSELGMQKTRFICLLEKETRARDLVFPESIVQQVPNDVLAQFSEMSELGFERAHFLMSANVGIEPQPIEKVASGGELSRVMLAIKNVLFNDTALSVFVFDEIDTGVSGQIAAKIGRKLAEFCESRQSICITHLAQVACFAHSHFVAHKKVVQNKTVTNLHKASEAERVEELAKMISGEKVTTESLAQAKRLSLEAKRIAT